MIVIGLTGSIGMGKSATSDMFRLRGVPVHDSDAAVHALYRGELVPLIEAAFPGATRDGMVDRAVLGAQVLNDDARMRKLESIVHPLVWKAEADFIAARRREGFAHVAIDNPLLLEARDPTDYDAIVVCSAAPEIQRARVLARPGMSVEKFNAIMARQMPDSDKRRRAHYVIDTGAGFAAAQAQVDAVLRALAAG
ncbi:MAG: dephospho-CoA kinase [Actinomycetia bacterium]|nr:dephospho-CoA kinase [Actinomycetes bacterium]